MKSKKINFENNFILFIRKKENLKTITLIGLVTIILFMVQFIKGDGFTGRYIEDNNGNIVGVMKNSGEEGLSVPIKYKATKGGSLSEEEILLYLNGSKKDSDENVKFPETIQSKMEEAIADIENTTDMQVFFPTELDDGTKINWERPQRKLNLYLLSFFPIIVLLLYQSSQNKIKKAKGDHKKAIERTLPMFNNQLLLLLNSGLIFNDAFNRIAIGYTMQDLSEKDCFEQGIVDIYHKSRDTNSSLIRLIIAYSKTVEVKEFSRLVSIISDNQYKGVNLSEKLEVESSILWEQRKKNAEEKGKIAETKLTFPLAILLLVLILITAAPAILQI